VIVHYGDPTRTIKAVLRHSELNVFSNIVIVANDLSQRPESLSNVPCTWLIPRRNIGFGGACQLGAVSCSADVYAFFNSHVKIDRAAVENCASAFDVPEVGIAAPYLFHTGIKGTLVDWRNTRCIRTYSRILGLPIQVPLETSPIGGNANQPDLIDNDWATGGAIFCRSEVVQSVGWDGSYFLSFEDVDISMRTKKAGWRVVVTPSAIAFHSGESTRTPTSSAYYAMRNRLWFARKYHNRRVQTLLTAYILFLVARLAAVDLLKRRRPARSKPATRGALDGWLLWPQSTEALSNEPLWSSDD
jgi:GT2 family glycosyltransferase